MRVRDESGFVLPTRLLALCVSAVAMAALVYIANDPEPAQEATAANNPATPATSAPPSSTAPSPGVTLKPKPKPKPKPIVRGEVYVEVYNNTHVTGLAGGVAARAKTAGWNVVGVDNWWGTFAGTTVYYPPDMERAAQLLATDLGIGRIRPAIDPMRLDRLTVILTDDYV